MNRYIYMCGALAIAACVNPDGPGSDSIDEAAFSGTCDPARAAGAVPAFQRALLDTVATTEGTYRHDANDGYDIAYGYNYFADCTQHPRVVYCGGGYCSDASGRYQFLSTTWDGLGYPNFYPNYQDQGAMDLVRGRGASVPGDRALSYSEFVDTMNKISYEWASLPPGRYGQPSVSMDQAWSIYTGYASKVNAGPRLVGARTGLNSNGSLELFVRGANGIDHIWEQGGTPTGWSGWNALGGPAGSNPAVGENSDGRLEVFIVGSDGNLWHRWQTAPHAGWIASWSNLGGGNLTGEPAVAMNTNGSMEVFARRADGSVAHIWEQPGTPTGWSGWGSLGGNIASNPAVGRNADGRLEVFAVGATGPLVHVWQTAPHSGWSGWGSFGGSFTSDPVVAPNADGRLQVFVRDGAAHLASTFELTGGGWSQFVTLGSFAFPANPRAGWTADARIEIMVRGYDGALWHVWQTSPNGGWSSGATFGGNITNDPNLAQNADGHLEVFVRGANGHVLHQWISPSGWTQLGDLGGAPASM